MSVTIRLSRVGSTHDPRYRIVVQPKRSKRDGEAIEVLGTYHPLQVQAQQVTLKKDRYDHWVSQGALPSRTVQSLYKRV